MDNAFQANVKCLEQILERKDFNDFSQGFIRYFVPTLLEAYKAETAKPKMRLYIWDNAFNTKGDPWAGEYGSAFAMAESKSQAKRMILEHIAKTYKTADLKKIKRNLNHKMPSRFNFPACGYSVGYL